MMKFEKKNQKPFGKQAAGLLSHEGQELRTGTACLPSALSK